MTKVINLRKGRALRQAHQRLQEFSDAKTRLDRERPYVGHKDTWAGKRGEKLVGECTYRDLGDVIHEVLTGMDASEICGPRSGWSLSGVAGNILMHLEQHRREAHGKKTN